ncbi:MAG: hypothetical protein QW103_00105 [Candidatus Pacearchaeota archaeon]
MGKQIHLKKIEELFDKSNVVDFKSIKRVVGNENYAKLLIHNLIKSKKIYKLSKGSYTKHLDSSLSVFAFSPAYLGLYSSLSFYGIWEQETIPVIITTKKIRRGLRNILGSNVLIKNIDKKYFFGFDLKKEGNFYLPYSDLEKTFIDFVFYNINLSEEIVSNLRRKIDKSKLLKYLKVYPQRIKNKVSSLLFGKQSLI